MNAEEFALKLKSNAPSASDYINKGYSEKLAIQIVKSFLITEKKHDSIFEDQLLRLIDLFKISDVEIGIVTFYENVQVKSNYYIVGEVEADWLIIDKITGTVQVVELFSDKKLWWCASNGSKFLDAILEVSKFITKTSLDINWADDQKYSCAVSEECGRIAGGDEFLDFYKMLLGCFE